MPKIVDHDQQRRTLLLHCFDLFRRRGYQSVTMREIAREIGASTGTLYHYFPNKLAILEQLYELAVVNDVGTLEDASTASLPTQAKLRRLAGIWVRRQRTTRSGLMLLALDLHRNSPAHSARLLAGYAARYKAALTRALGVSPEVADAAFTYLLGANLHALLAPKDYDFPQRAHLVERALAEAMSSPRGRSLPEQLGKLARKRTRKRR
jgi:AcrR family transcriptional regulator